MSRSRVLDYLMVTRGLLRGIEHCELWEHSSFTAVPRAELMHPNSRFHSLAFDTAVYQESRHGTRGRSEQIREYRLWIR